MYGILKLLSAPLLPRDVCLNDGGLGNNVIKAIHDGLPDSHLLSPSEISGKHPSIVWGILRGSDSVIGKCQLHNSDWYHIDHSYLNRGYSIEFLTSLTPSEKTFVFVTVVACDYLIIRCARGVNLVILLLYVHQLNTFLSITELLIGLMKQLNS